MIRKNKEIIEYIRRLIQEDFFQVEELCFKRDEIMIEQGKKGFHLYMIDRGIAKCYLTEDNGNHFIQEFLSEGEIFGEVEIFNKNSANICTIQAITETRIYKISGNEFIRLIQEDFRFNLLFINSLTQKTKYKAIRHSYNQSHTIGDKLENLKSQFPQLLEIISKQDISNYLGITQRSLNRVLKQS